MYADNLIFLSRTNCQLLDRTIRILPKNANIKLTTLTHPQEQMGHDAADWVIKKLQGKKDLPNETYYQPVLIEGETVKELDVQ